MTINKKDFSVETPQESSGFLLWQVASLWQKEIKKSLEEFLLTHTQFVLLASMLWFSQSKESITQIQLSTHARIDAMTTSTVLGTLQKKGLIQRGEHATDARAKALELTEKGKKLAAQAVKKVEACDREFFVRLGKNLEFFNQQLVILSDSRKND